MNINLASSKTGARVICASSYDDKHSSDNIIDSDDSSFWITTGSFPQEVVIQLGTLSSIVKIKMTTTNARHLVIEKCLDRSPSSWEKVLEYEIDDNEGRFQVESHQVKVAATFLKFKFLDSYSDFITVHKVGVEGRLSSGD